MKQTHTFTLRFFLIGIGLVFTTSIRAIPASRITKTVTLVDGSVVTLRLVGDEFCHFYVDSLNQKYIKQQDGLYKKLEQSKSQNRMLRAAQMRDSKKATRLQRSAALAPRGLVILVNFQDLQFQQSNTAAVMDSMLNGANYTYDRSIGSVRKYFSDQSAGQYTPIFDVVGPITLPYDMAHYGTNDAEDYDVLPGDFVLHACSIASEIPGIDFSNYDFDQDGWLDFVYLIYAGYGEAESGNENELWPISWSLPATIAYGYSSLTDYTDSVQYSFGGKAIGLFAFSSELNYRTTYRNLRGFSPSNPKRNGIGTLCHEFSHVIGLKDYYDTEYGYNSSNNLTPGTYSLMDYGNYNMDGDVPPNYSNYDRYFLGWCTPTHLTDSQEVTIPNGDYSGYCITLNDSLPTPFDTAAVYYLENRQKTGWDAGISYHGMLIWKIRYDSALWYNNQVNTIYNDPHVMLIPAGGDYYDTNAIPFPGTGNITNYNDIANHSISNILEQDGNISFSFSSSYIPTPDIPDEPENPEAGFENPETDNAEKYIRDGQIYIRKNGEIYSILGSKL